MKSNDGLYTFYKNIVNKYIDVIAVLKNAIADIAYRNIGKNIDSLENVNKYFEKINFDKQTYRMEIDDDIYKQYIGYAEHHFKKEKENQTPSSISSNSITKKVNEQIKRPIRQRKTTKNNAANSSKGLYSYNELLKRVTNTLTDYVEGKTQIKSSYNYTGKYDTQLLNEYLESDPPNDFKKKQYDDEKRKYVLNKVKTYLDGLSKPAPIPISKTGNTSVDQEFNMSRPLVSFSSRKNSSVNIVTDITHAAMKAIVAKIENDYFDELGSDNKINAGEVDNYDPDNLNKDIYTLQEQNKILEGVTNVLEERLAGKIKTQQNPEGVEEIPGEEQKQEEGEKTLEEEQPKVDGEQTLQIKKTFLTPEQKAANNGLIQRITGGIINLLDSSNLPANINEMLRTKIFDIRQNLMSSDAVLNKDSVVQRFNTDTIGTFTELFKSLTKDEEQYRTEILKIANTFNTENGELSINYFSVISAYYLKVLQSDVKTEFTVPTPADIFEYNLQKFIDLDTKIKGLKDVKYRTEYFSEIYQKLIKIIDIYKEYHQDSSQLIKDYIETFNYILGKIALRKNNVNSEINEASAKANTIIIDYHNKELQDKIEDFRKEHSTVNNIDDFIKTEKEKQYLINIKNEILGLDTIEARTQHIDTIFTNMSNNIKESIPRSDEDIQKEKDDEINRLNEGSKIENLTEINDITKKVQLNGKKLTDNDTLINGCIDTLTTIIKDKMINLSHTVLTTIKDGKYNKLDDEIKYILGNITQEKAIRICYQIRIYHLLENNNDVQKDKKRLYSSASRKEYRDFLYGIESYYENIKKDFREYGYEDEFKIVLDRLEEGNSNQYIQQIHNDYAKVVEPIEGNAIILLVNKSIKMIKSGEKITPSYIEANVNIKQDDRIIVDLIYDKNGYTNANKKLFDVISKHPNIEVSNK